MIPPKLSDGNEVRIIAPSTSARIVSREIMEASEIPLRNLGLKVSLGDNINILDEFDSSSIDQRLEDLFNAYADNEVNAIMSAIGGFDCKSALESHGLRYLIKLRPKILCGCTDVNSSSKCDLC